MIKLTLDSDNSQEKKNINHQEVGTLAIDLGNSTTVVAFQNEANGSMQLLDMPPLTRIPGEIPSLVCRDANGAKGLAVGNEIFELDLHKNNHERICSDFKRWICSPKKTNSPMKDLEPEEAGKILLKSIWEKIPKNIKVKRLVLTAPVETYREYRKWLVNSCSELEVDEIALVDEPTAAAMGAGLLPGSKLLVVDIGGSTIDMSLVALEGGQGKAEPVAQLLRFNGNDLSNKTNQILRCAKVLGKAGGKIGGRDIDRWILNYLCPECEVNETSLNAAERLKCKLSNDNEKESKVLYEEINIGDDQENIRLRLSRLDLETLLKEKGLIKTLNSLFKHTLESASVNGCSLEQLDKIVLVGGGSRIPLIRKWLQDQCKPVELLLPPSIEAVVIGALHLTPGVKIKDVLQKGVYLRCWDQKYDFHHWHPLFIAGQPWPTAKPLEIILAASKKNQEEIELVTGEPSFIGSNEIIYVNGIPTIKPGINEPTIEKRNEKISHIKLNQPIDAGKDCLCLNFSINNDCDLIIEGINLIDNSKIDKVNLGSIR